MGAKLRLKQMLLTSLVLSAVVGIYALLFGNFGHTVSGNQLYPMVQQA